MSQGQDSSRGCKMEQIEFADWKKLKLKVGKVMSAEKVPKTEKLYKINVDIGLEEPIQIISSLVQYYTIEEIVGKKIIVLTNLKPAKFAGLVSSGMLLCAEKEDGSECVLLTIDKEIKEGTEIS